VMDKRILDQEMREVFFRSAVFAFLLLVVSAVAIFILIRRATGPLTSLTESVRRLGMGESVEKMSVESRDEIGKLAAAFNTMSENLKKREEEKQALEEKLRYSQKMEAALYVSYTQLPEQGEVPYRQSHSLQQNTDDTDEGHRPQFSHQEVETDAGRYCRRKYRSGALPR
jgi:nitrate/nitrite-specific signal transduction histidine kinase